MELKAAGNLAPRQARRNPLHGVERAWDWGLELGVILGIHYMELKVGRLHTNIGVPQRNPLHGVERSGSIDTAIDGITTNPLHGVER